MGTESSGGKVECALGGGVGRGFLKRVPHGLGGEVLLRGGNARGQGGTRGDSVVTHDPSQNARLGARRAPVVAVIAHPWSGNPG